MLPSNCTPATFSPSLFGADILAVNAYLVANHSAFIPSIQRFGAPSVNLTDASFCNVTVTYTHPGQNDEINVEAWLPIDGWNNRLQAVGGGGFIAGRSDSAYVAMNGAIADGFAAVTTDAGLSTTGNVSLWALKSPGNIDWNNIQNLAHISLNDQAIIGKSLVKDFYGKRPTYSYWTGCSQGGRQGLMLAQRYPTAYDGIIAVAPAIYWNQNAMGIQWPQQVMNELGEYPAACEFEAIAEAAVNVCDALDGVVDGIISNVEECLISFDPFSVVGKKVKCLQRNGTQIQVSNAAATVANASWKGVTDAAGHRLWHGPSPGTDISGLDPRSAGIPASAQTRCNETRCIGDPVLGNDWVKLFLIRNDPAVDLKTLSRSEYIDLFHASLQQYSSIIGTTDPDLSRFRQAGGKMISYHGTIDQLLPVKATEQYYDEVTKIDPNVHDFFRFYKVPGLGHCWGGRSGQPEQLFRQLRDWVEDDKAPYETPIKVQALNDEEHNRILCPYPQVARFDEGCGNPADSTCWHCEKTCGKVQDSKERMLHL